MLPQPAPVVEVAPTALPPSEPEPPPAPPPGVLDAGSPIATVVDAGSLWVEVVVEVFGSKGHAAGASVSFHADPADRFDYRRLTDPAAEFGAAVGGGRTNVMGFTTVNLPVGRWRVNPVAEPQYVTIAATTKEISIQLREPWVVRGIVVDAAGKGIARAEVLVRRDIASNLPSTYLSKPILADAEGRFAYQTFDSSLLLGIRHRAGKRDRIFEKRVNVPSPEVRLYGGALGMVQLVRSGIGEAPLEVAFETADAFSGTEVVGVKEAIPVAPGRVKLVARAVVDDARFAGAAEADVNPGETARVPIEMRAAPPQRIHVKGEDGTPRHDVRVELRSNTGAWVARSNERGDALFSPGVSAGRPAKVMVAGSCIAPAPFVTALTDELSVTVVPCDGGIVAVP